MNLDKCALYLSYRTTSQLGKVLLSNLLSCIGVFCTFTFMIVWKGTIKIFVIEEFYSKMLGCQDGDTNMFISYKQTFLFKFYCFF